MKIFRSHIIRFSGTFLLLAGIIFYFFNPLDEKGQHEAFASWLQSHLKTQDNAAVNDQIQKLSFLDEEFESVIRKASVVVQNHPKDFELPVGEKNGDENEVFQLLLSEWNAFQDFAKGMGKVAIIKTAKPHSVLPTDALAFSGKFSPQQTNPILLPETKFSYEILASQDFHLSPHKSGTAIGAP